MEAQTKLNYPLAGSAQLRNLMTKDLLAAEGNEMRFVSRKPLIVNMKKRDDFNKHFIRHPEAQ